MNRLKIALINCLTVAPQDAYEIFRQAEDEFNVVKIRSYQEKTDLLNVLVKDGVAEKIMAKPKHGFGCDKAYYKLSSEFVLARDPLCPRARC